MSEHGILSCWAALALVGCVGSRGPGSVNDLAAAYDAFNAASAAGDVDRMLSLTGSEVATELRADLADPAKRREYVAAMSDRVPGSYRVADAWRSPDGQRARLDLTVQRRDATSSRAPLGPCERVSYLREAGVWRITSIEPRCPDVGAARGG